MTNDETAALEWVGRESQRMLKLSGVPFVVLGVVALAPGFLLANELQLWLFVFLPDDVTAP